MPAWLLSVLKFLPGIGKLFDKLGADSSRVQELKAEAELEEIKAFRKAGRVGPTMLRRYVAVGIWVLVVVALLVAVFVPGAVRIDWQAIVNAGRGILELW